MMRLFVTGMVRSGTTLVEKILHAHPAVSVASQPFFTLYVALKERFNRVHGLPSLLPLSTLFGKEAYPPEQLTRFLHEERLDEEALRAVVAAAERLPDRGSMTVTKALLSPQVLMRCPVSAAALLDVAHDLVAKAYPKGDLLYAGTKEVLCEEFIPHFLEAGYRVVLVIRDPRDVTASMNQGVGEVWVGPPRPVLFIARCWRKSVAFAARYGGHPSMCVCRHEDMARGGAARVRLFNFLSLRPEDSYACLRDQEGRAWVPNTSFPGDARTRRAMLPVETRRFIEKLTTPEMAFMGYAPEDAEEVVRFRLEQYVEPHCTRPEFAPLLSAYDREIATEEAYLAAPERVFEGVRPWA
jgi:hypothetical protein